MQKSYELMKLFSHFEGALTFLVYLRLTIALSIHKSSDTRDISFLENFLNAKELLIDIQ